MAGNATIGALRVSLGLDSAQFEDGLKSAQNSLGKFGKTAGVAVAAAVTAATAAVTALGYAVKGVIDYADEMDKAAQKFGVPIEDLTRLKYAAEMSNVSFESLGTGLRKLAQNMDDAATGGFSRGAEAFQRLGVEVRNTDGSMRSQSDVMGDLAAKFETMPDGAQKTALAMQIFGKSGADLIPILNEGKAGLAALTAEADAFGLVIGSETAAQADAFNDNLDRMGKIWDGLVIKLTAHLLPYLEKLSEILLSFVRDKGKVEGFFNAITDSMKWLVEAVYLATVRIQQLGSTWADFRALMQAPIGTEQFTAASDKFAATVAGNVETMKVARDELARMWDTSTNGLGANFGTGWTSGAGANDNAPFVPGAVDTEEAARDQERIDAKLERLRASLMTEEESEYASYQKRLEQLAEFQSARVLSDQEAAALRGQIEKDHNDQMAQMQEQRLNDFASTIGSVGSILGSLTQIMGKEGDKQLGLMKALSLAEGLINVYTGITAALRLPFPANIAAAASVAAQGFATLASMKSVSKGSSGGGHSAGGAGGGSSAAVAPAASAGPNAGQSMHVSFKGDFTGPGAEQIAKQLNAYVKDGGTLYFSKAA